MGKRQNAGYSGELKKPIVLPLDLAFGPPPAKPDQWHRRRSLWALSAQLEKLKLLLDHFGISPKSEHCWLLLSLCLAKEHVPGMQLASAPTKRGRPPEGPSNLELAIAINTIRAERFLDAGKETSVKHAIQILQKRQPLAWGRYKETTLRNRYHEHSKGGPKGKTAEEQLRALFLGKVQP